MVSGQSTLVVNCACGKKLKAPAASAGKKARCPACGSIMVLTANGSARAPVAAQSSTVSRKAPTAAASAPRPTRSPAAPIATPPAHDDNLGAMYDLAEQASSTSAPAAVRCPQCKSPMDDGAVLCTNCGYDTRSRKPVSSASIATALKPPPDVAPGKKAKPIDRMAPQGSFIAGLAMSAAFALASSVLWFVVAWLTGYGISYIAILIGCAAGVGMRIGHKGFSATGGFAAAAMTFAAILAAKLAVLEVFATQRNPHFSIFNANPALLANYFFRPISLIIMVIGMFAAFRTANGSIKG